MAVRTVFWDVDTQVDFMLPDGELYVHGADGLIPALARLTEGARAAGVAIVHSTVDHDLSDAEIDVKGGDFVDTFPPHCLSGSAGAERVSATAAAAGAAEIAWDGSGFDAGVVAAAPAVVLRKKWFDVFSNPATERVLATLAPERVVVYGVALDLGVCATVEGMGKLGGFGIVVVRDAVLGVVPSNGRRLLKEWAAAGVVVATTDEVIAAL